MHAMLRSLTVGAVLALSLLLVPAFPVSTSSTASGQSAVSSQPTPELYETLHWRTIGPEGNRFSAAAGIPGDPQTYYVGAASGGI